MKRKLKKFGYTLILTLHLLLVLFVPLVPWILLWCYQHNWLIAVGVVVFVGIQLPIMFYASTKEQSIIDKLLDKIIFYSKK
jgi:protein-S-isoprenylcysteine O-methyltransferase Ste14